MGIIDEVRQMQGKGVSDQQIISALRQQGMPDTQISEVLSQSRIKNAVSSNDGSLPPLPPLNPNQVYGSSGGRYDSYGQQGDYASSYEGMQPSMLTTEEPPLPSLGNPQGNYSPGQEMPVPSPGGTYQNLQASMPSVTSGYSKDTYEMAGGFESAPYQQYQQYDETSSDTMAEITEQVVSEKLSFIQDKLEKAIGFKTIAETKLNSLDERVQRIERIMDRLQLSLLQKVGEFVSDVKETKRELIENRKSFKALLTRNEKESETKKSKL